MFSSLLDCNFVCLFVCLLRDNAWTYFHEIFGWARYNAQSRKIGRGIAVSGGVMFNPFHTRLLFIFFKEIRVCQQHYGKTDPQIFMKFLRKVAHETRNRREHFQGVAVNHVNPGFFFFYFLDLYLLAILWRNRWTDFHEILRICQAWHNK